MNGTARISANDMKKGDGLRSATLFGLLALAILAAAVACAWRVVPRDRLAAYAPGRSVVYLHARGRGLAIAPTLDPLNSGAVETARFAVKTGEGQLAWGTLLRLGYRTPTASAARLRELDALRLTNDIYAYGDAAAVTAVAETSGQAASLAERAPTAEALDIMAGVMPLQGFIAPQFWSVSLPPTALGTLPAREPLIIGLDRDGHFARVSSESAVLRHRTWYGSDFSLPARTPPAADALGGRVWSADVPAGLVNLSSVILNQAGQTVVPTGERQDESTRRLTEALNRPTDLALYRHDVGSVGFVANVKGLPLAELEKTVTDFLNATRPVTESLNLPDGEQVRELRLSHRFAFVGSGAWKRLTDTEDASAKNSLLIKDDGQGGSVITDSVELATAIESKNAAIATGLCSRFGSPYVWLNDNMAESLARELGLGSLVSLLRPQFLIIHRLDADELNICG